MEIPISSERDRLGAITKYFAADFGEVADFESPCARDQLFTVECNDPRRRKNVFRVVRPNLADRHKH